MKTIDFRGHGLLKGPATLQSLEGLAAGVAGHCKQAIFVGYVGEDEKLLGCSVLLGTCSKEATQAALHIIELAIDLDAIQLDVFEIEKSKLRLDGAFD